MNLNELQQLSFDEAEKIPKTMIERVNLSSNDSIMGSNMLETYATSDGGTLYYNFGNGYGQWFKGEKK